MHTLGERSDDEGYEAEGHATTMTSQNKAHIVAEAKINFYQHGEIMRKQQFTHKPGVAQLHMSHRALDDVPRALNININYLIQLHQSL